MHWLQGSGVLGDMLQGDGLRSDGLHDDALWRWVACAPYAAGVTAYQIGVLFVQSVGAQNDPVLQTPFRRTMIVCTTAGIGIIVASTLLVEHTKSGEYRGRHGGTYK